MSARMKTPTRSFSTLKKAGKKPGGLEQDGLLPSRAREGFGVRKDEDTLIEFAPPLERMRAPASEAWILGWDCGLSRAREGFGVRKDEDTWSIFHQAL